MAKDLYGNPSTPITGNAIDTDYGSAVVDRIVGVYPTTTARDAALTAPDKGQIVYISGDDELQIWEGTAWSTVAKPTISEAATDTRTDATPGIASPTTYKALTDILWYYDTDEVEVTVTTDVRALVLFKATLANNTAGKVTQLSYAVSGATTLAADNVRSIYYESSNANDRADFSGFDLLQALTPGSNTFTLWARVDGGVGTITRPKIAVIPL